MGLNSNSYSFSPFVINQFGGGMRMDVDPSRLGEGEYFLLINGRVRNNKPTPVKLPSIESGIPAGLKQGIFGAGSVLAVVQDGLLYVRDFASNLGWQNFSNFGTMNATVANIYGVLLPASSVNFVRTTAGNPQDTVSLTDNVTSQPRCLLLQDGISQPRLVFSDGTSRSAATFAEWHAANVEPPPNRSVREYVPIGKHMVVHNEKLYIASPDGLEIYQSVSGRYLDFVVAIDTEGRKLTDGLYNIEASRLSHKVDYAPISCLATINIPPQTDFDPPFFAGTSRTSYLVTPNPQRLIFGEPIFKNTTLFGVGPLNQNSFIEMLGDYALIDESGIRSFNAISQYSNEGRNSPFSLSVARLFEGIVQDTTCAIFFDNYGLFAVKTIYGYGILVFDPNIQRFVSLDIYPGIGAIKQFAEIKVGTQKRLFFITASSVYEAFAGSSATLELYPREFVTSDRQYEHRMQSVTVTLRNITSAGDLIVQNYGDELLQSSNTQVLLPNSTVQSGDQARPYGNVTQDAVRNIKIPFSLASRAHKVGCGIKLSAAAEILEVEVATEVWGSKNTEEEKAKVYGT